MASRGLPVATTKRQDEKAAAKLDDLDEEEPMNWTFGGSGDEGKSHGE